MHWLLVIFVLSVPLLFDPLWVRAGNRFHERNHSGLLALYGFDDGQLATNLLPTTARDYTGLGYLGNLTTSTSTITWQADRAGFAIPSRHGGFRAVSQQSTLGLLQHIQSEFTIEFFLKSPSNPGSSVLVAGFGEWAPGAAFPVCDPSETATAEGGWRLYSAPGNVMNFQVLMSVNGVPDCFEAGFVNVPDTLRHCVIRSRNNELSVVSHGAIGAVEDPSVSFNRELWMRHETHLTYAVPQPSNGWKGTMYMTAIYDRYLTSTEIEAKQNLGPPNSLPVASVSSLPVDEDVTEILYP